MSWAVFSERWCPSLSDLMNCIKTFLSSSWKFFTETDVPGLGFSFAVLLIGLVLIPVSLSFLSLILGFSVGSIPDVDPIVFGSSRGSSYSRRTALPGGAKYRLPEARKNDVR